MVSVSKMMCQLKEISDYTSSPIILVRVYCDTMNSLLHAIGCTHLISKISKSCEVCICDIVMKINLDCLLSSIWDIHMYSI